MSTIYNNQTSYRKGIQFLDEGKFRLALEFFKRVKKYLETNGVETGEPWLKVNRKYYYIDMHTYTLK
jgi:hypothetical protein